MYGGRQQFVGGGYGVGGGGQGPRGAMGVTHLGQSGMGGVDQAQLVSTLVNVATNILSGAGQGGQGVGLGGHRQGGILGSSPRDQQSTEYGSNKAGYGVGVGGVANGNQQHGRVWAGQVEERWRSSAEENVRKSRTAGDYNEKNYRPKIKVEGMPPNYFNGDYEHLNSKHFSCANCDKRNMWDAESFVKHLRGQKHINKVGDFLMNMHVALVPHNSEPVA